MRGSGELAGALIALSAAIAAVIVGASVAPQPAGAQRGSDREPPNIVVLMSDDQTLDSMRYMSRTSELIGGQGATFPTTITNWPLCCPSRATFLTGQYAHNHGVLGNGPPLGGFDRLGISETLPVWLQRQGYYTAQIGKFLNGYESSTVTIPPGWSEWHGTKRTYTYYGEQLFEDGQLNTYGSVNEDPDAPAQPQFYSTDLFTDKAVDVINRQAPAEQPFFLYVAYLAPHGGNPNSGPNDTPGRCESTAKPAARHIGAFGSEPLPQPPSFNEADVSDKPPILSGRESMDPGQIAAATRNYRCRAESLLAVDEGVGRVVEALRASGELDNTLIVYTSDNGFFHGEHRITSGKNRVYEEAIKVPLLIRGPGIPAGVTVSDLASNADLAPTILDAADADAGRVEDGQSLLPFAAHPERERGRELLIEQYTDDSDEDGTPGVNYAALRNKRYSYVEYGDGSIELYDVQADPFELDNQAANPAFAEPRAALASRLATLRGCAGPSCRTKPSLKLELPRSVRENGGSCRDPKRFVAKLRGPGARSVTGVVFRIGSKRAGSDDAKPLKAAIRPGLLKRKRRPEVRAIADFIDGRELTLQKRVRICS